jgi:hypothetical protein
MTKNTPHTQFVRFALRGVLTTLEQTAKTVREAPGMELAAQDIKVTA